MAESRSVKSVSTSSFSRDQFSRLKAKMEAARAEYYRANGEFRIFVAHGTGLPAPDGNLRAKQVAAVHSAALRKYTGALRRFNAFLVNGELTEDQVTPEL